MKKIALISCILLVFTFMFTVSACNSDDWNYEYNGMTFWLIKHETEDGEKDYYYMAGNLHDKDVVNYFIPMTINGYPVREFGYARFTNPGAGTIYLRDLSLQKLYMPSTIIGQGYNYEYLSGVHQDMQIYYCGEVIDLYPIYPYDSNHKIDYYVPLERFDQFENALGTESTFKPTTSHLYKANISYRLNSEDMCEYYYVDNIEAGSKIVNIPPEPTRAGYTFGGWYTEKECVNKWNFNNVPTVSNNDDSFVEFRLYAKWTKK